MHYIGHFHFRRTVLTAQSLSIELDRSTNNRIRVTFKISVAEFNDLSKFLKIIREEIEPN